MVMGKSSYTGKQGRRRRRNPLHKKPFSFGAWIPIPNLLRLPNFLRGPGRTLAGSWRFGIAKWAGGNGAGMEALSSLRRKAQPIWRWSKPVLPILVLLHLALVALFPSGRNLLLGVAPGEGPRYLTLFQVGDAMGFEQSHDGFLVFRIFPQGGGAVQGVYPEDRVLPRLRQDRWALAGHIASGPHPRLHQWVLDGLLKRLPSPPVRLELYSARYRWDRDSLTFPWPGKGPKTALDLKRLGVYSGFTRKWNPVAVRTPGENREP